MRQGAKKPTVLILYHYFHPDNVISSQHLTQFGQELQKRNWQVLAMPCNRSCRDNTKKYKSSDDYNGINIRRIWRPGFRQASKLGRLVNAIWMILAWSFIAFRKISVPDVDVLVVGTDPILGILVASVWKIIRPKTRIVHWCFDLYPDAAIAEGFLKPESILVKSLKRLLHSAYDACDLIVDIGCCMRQKLEKYNDSTKKITLTPWALVEPNHALPNDISQRQTLFGDTKLCVLYSGNFGLAHSYDAFLDLSRSLNGHDIKFSYSVRGNRADELKDATQRQDKNISFAPFAPQDKLQARLSSADIHLVSLKHNWTGTVVPSKFFGSLAAGRPVIFAGSPDSAIAKWITDYNVGWVLTADSLDSVAHDLIKLSHSPQELTNLQQHCNDIYRKHFSRKIIMDNWDIALNSLLDGAYQANTNINPAMSSFA